MCSMNKVYTVQSVYRGGFETLIGICPSKELAQKLAQRVKNLHDLKDNEITSDKWDEMLAAYSESIENGVRPLLEVLFELYPEYSVKDIEEAYNEYTNRSYGYTYIKAVDMFTNELDIISYGNNS